MTSTPLHRYLIAQLPDTNPAEDRMTAFFALPEVADSVNRIEQLTAQLVADWARQPFVATPEPPAEAIPEITPVPATGVISGARRTYSFLAPRHESGGLAWANIPRRVAPVPAVVSPPIAPVETVRFTDNVPPEPPKPTPPRVVTIPNATVGKPYTHTFGLSAPDIIECVLTPATAAGLTYDPATQTLAGTPTDAGDVVFGLTYRLKTDEPGRPALARTVQLLVNPDPRSLWKDLPSDPGDPYYKPDSARQLLTAGEVRLLAASVRGRSHAHEGKFRDDDFSLAQLADTGWYLLAVADGAGSARYSRRGAQLACQTVTAHLQTAEPGSWEKLDAVVGQYAGDSREAVADTVQRQLYNVLGNAVFAAYKAIESEAAGQATEPKDFATTLITVLAKPVATGWFVGAFWVGDGGVGIYQPAREPVILGTPDGGEYAGQTRFLTMSETISSNFFGRFRFALVPDLAAIVLMTDGITDPKFQTDSNLNRKEKWDDLWADLNQEVAFADDDRAPDQLQQWLTFWSPGNHDDRTIALLYTHAGDQKN